MQVNGDNAVTTDSSVDSASGATGDMISPFFATLADIATVLSSPDMSATIADCIEPGCRVACQRRTTGKADNVDSCSAMCAETM
jgi:hypothetical protein